MSSGRSGLDLTHRLGLAGRLGLDDRPVPDGAPTGPEVGAPSGEVGSGAADGPIWLNAYAARSCAVKTHNQFDPTVATVSWQPDETLQELFNGGDGFESAVVDRLVRESGLSVVDLRLLADQPWPVQQAASAQAVADGVDLIVGALLPPTLADGANGSGGSERTVGRGAAGRTDGTAGRLGSVDLLVRGGRRPDGRHGYHAGEIKWHKLHERRTLTGTTRPNTALLLAELDAPARDRAVRKWGYGFRTHTREADLLQVAHYHRMLEAAGWSAPGRPAAMLVGTDDWAGRTLVTWVDLDEPLLRTFSRSADPRSDRTRADEGAASGEGWTLHSPLERYDHEFGFRVAVAEVARRQDQPDPPAPLVEPVVVKECGRCEWWEHCATRLDPDDISLRIGSGALDIREIGTLRAHGIRTVAQLAAADLDEVAVWYLPEVAHRTSAADRLAAAARRARMLLADVAFVRTTDGPIRVPADGPAFATEVDLDIETSADGRVYLWGFLLGGRYRSFAAFEDLDDEAERALAAEALGWLRETVLAGGRTGVYHYSEFETNHLHRLATDPGATPDQHELFAWVDAFATGRGGLAGLGGFVDLLGVVKAHFFGARGLGLKVVASDGAGFAWRDDDPGGLNSQRWFLDAVHGETGTERRAARERLLAYNEDDVIATARVRDWLRSQP
ncbi:putative RecB family nuclease [Friedmanniella endophytica]|uniref:Putative RecB family nuclease n=1 Tax=Microlunatus kandeliicorticis TaxID=1759536 RepID=A0A7W3IPB9_9ACTN|nr:TM0106 family RecB-like putative nuclease [Microlunatus kandeliicorticis]MBA8792767.1 putative RecB family nuclease [Microlunatus kandeliicorticis]